MKRNAVQVPEFCSLETLMDIDFGPEQWVVDLLFPEIGFSIIAADPKTGKSTFVRQLCICIANAVPFLERPVSQGPILYMVMDEEPRDVQEHFQTILLSYRKHYPELSKNNIDMLFLRGRDCDEVRPAFESALESKEYSLVVLDTLVNILPESLDLNNYVQTLHGLKYFTRFASKHQTHILAVHHTNKGSSGLGQITSILGSQVIRGATDTNMVLYKDDVTKRYITTEQRRGKEWHDVEVHMAEDGLLYLGRSRIDEMMDQIVDFLGGGDATVTEIINSLGNKDLTTKALWRAQQIGWVSREGKKYFCSPMPQNE